MKSKKYFAVFLVTAILFTFFTSNAMAAEKEEVLPMYNEVTEYVSTQSSTVVSTTIIQSAYISRQNPKLVASVARGSYEDVERTFTFTFAYSAHAQAAIDAAIKANFDLSTTANVTIVSSVKKRFYGPEAPYSSRDFYVAVAYDRYAITLRNYNKYNVYRLDGGVMTFVRTEYAYANETVYVNVPRKQEYSVDVV